MTNLFVRIAHFDETSWFASGGHCENRILSDIHSTSNLYYSPLFFLYIIRNPKLGFDTYCLHQYYHLALYVH